MTPSLRHVDAQVADAGERVVPGVPLEAGVGLEEPARDPCPFGGAPEGLRVFRFGVEGHYQRIGADRGERRRSTPVVDIGGARTPGAELGGRHGQVDTRIGRPLVVLAGDAGRRVGGRHGAVDGEPGGIAHLVEERGLDSLFAGGEHQFEVGAGMDVGAHRPGAALDGLDRWQPNREGEPVEVEVGGVEAAEAIPENAEGEAAPVLGMEGAVEEGLPLHRLAVEGHRQRAVARGGGDGTLDRDEALVGHKRNGGAVGPGGVGFDYRGLLLAEEAVGRERDAPAGCEVQEWPACPGGDGAAALGQRVDADAGGVFPARRVFVPGALAEGQQHGRVGDAVSVVGDGDADAAGSLGFGEGLDDDIHTGRVGATCVLYQLDERAGERSIEKSRNPVDGAVMDAPPGSRPGIRRDCSW